MIFDLIVTYINIVRVVTFIVEQTTKYGSSVMGAACAGVLNPVSPDVFMGTGDL